MAVWLVKVSVAGDSVTGGSVAGDRQRGWWQCGWWQCGCRDDSGMGRGTEGISLQHGALGILF